MVGSDAVIRVLSVIAPSLSGTLKSTRTSTRCPAGVRSFTVFLRNVVVVVGDRHTIERLSEEHATVETAADGVRVGDRREVIPAHCCATMNLHRSCVAVRGGRVEALWPVEASGRYD